MEGSAMKRGIRKLTAAVAAAALILTAFSAHTVFCGETSTEIVSSQEEQKKAEAAEAEKKKAEAAEAEKKKAEAAEAEREKAEAAEAERKKAEAVEAEKKAEAAEAETNSTISDIPGNQTPSQSENSVPSLDNKGTDEQSPDKGSSDADYAAGSETVSEDSADSSAAGLEEIARDSADGSSAGSDEDPDTAPEEEMSERETPEEESETEEMLSQETETEESLQAAGSSPATSWNLKVEDLDLEGPYVLGTPVSELPVPGYSFVNVKIDGEPADDYTDEKKDGWWEYSTDNGTSFSKTGETVPENDARVLVRYAVKASISITTSEDTTTESTETQYSDAAELVRRHKAPFSVFIGQGGAYADFSFDCQGHKGMPLELQLLSESGSAAGSAYSFSVPAEGYNTTTHFISGDKSINLFSLADSDLNQTVKLQITASMGSSHILDPEPFYSNTLYLVSPITGSVSIPDSVMIGDVVTLNTSAMKNLSNLDVTYPWTLGKGRNTKAISGQKSISYTVTLEDMRTYSQTALRCTATDSVGCELESNYATVQPLDLAKANVKLGYDVDPQYTGSSVLPESCTVCIGDYVLPSDCYKLSFVNGRNSVKPGDAYVMVNGIDEWVTGSRELSYRIRGLEQEIDEEDNWITTFTYDGHSHMPVAKKLPKTAGKVIYGKDWQRETGSGDWVGISSAPVQPGTYSVTVKVKSKNKLYEAWVYEDMEFTILPGTLQSDPVDEADLTVTNLEGKPVPYKIVVTEEKDAEGKKTLRMVYTILTYPDMKEDGTPVLMEDGTERYTQRDLHIGRWMIEDAKNKDCSLIRLCVKDAGVDVAVSELVRDQYTIRLAPVNTEDELEEEEKALLGRYITKGGIYYSAITSYDQEAGKEIDVAQEFENCRVILFCEKEDYGTQSFTVPEWTLLIGREDGIASMNNTVLVETDTARYTEAAIRSRSLFVWTQAQLEEAAPAAG